MNKKSSPPPVTPRTSAPEVRMNVSSYDTVAAGLVTALILMGAVVTTLFIIWATTRVWRSTPVVQVEMIEEIAGRGDAPLGSARDLEEPAQDEIEDLAEPPLEDTMTAITDAITTQQATLDTLESETSAVAKGRGKGDSRQAGPRGEGRDIVPRWERWEIQYESSSLASYADKLSFFGVELAAFGGGQPEIDYVSGLTKKVPDKRTVANAEGETRIYFTWRHGPLRAADRELLRRAGVKVEGRNIVQFFPPQVENTLAILEDEELKKRKLTLEQVKKTVFSVMGEPGKYEMKLVSVQERFGR